MATDTGTPNGPTTGGGYPQGTVVTSDTVTQLGSSLGGSAPSAPTSPAPNSGTGANVGIPTTTAGSGVLTASDASALATITGFLGQYGLASLANWAWGKWQDDESVDQIMLELRSTPEYKQRFPAMDALAKQGQAISEAQYIGYEQSIAQLTQAAGLPPGMYNSPDQIAKMLVNNVSVTEAHDRVAAAVSAVYSMPDSTRQALTKDFGVPTGGMVGYFLDSDKALPILQRQLAAANLAGAGLEQGVDIGADTATALAQQGVTYAQAQQGLGQVAQTQALGAGAGETSDQDTRIAAAFGNAGANAQVTRVVKGRLAAASGGGGAAAVTQGVSGLGSSTRQP